MRRRTYARRYTWREVLVWQGLGWFGCAHWSRHPYWKAT
jgi:hypothetical protein